MRNDRQCLKEITAEGNDAPRVEALWAHKHQLLKNVLFQIAKINLDLWLAVRHTKFEKKKVQITNIVILTY